MKVLVVEDIHSIRRLVRRMLSRHGHAVEDAATGGDALRTFASGRFDAAVLDVDLGGGCDGVEVARRLRESSPGIKLVIMSGDQRHADRVARAGFGPLLPKPFPECSLLALLGP